MPDEISTPRDPLKRPVNGPWLRPEDAKGWEVVARGRDNPNRPPVGIALHIELTREQAAWVREISKASGETYVGIVRRLIDEARIRPDAD